ncbi:hypothetical protein [Hansschlegelia sp.]|uniref:hypothetical protein n=1 Tax=Hansschlegelia sp. TaxID=2041892 RepID=UPI002CF18EFF|nr:hypothetical protein [Hansschlegelia sp.]HVI28871.1 hypothetical protein [Hansschlegelia sp.]
MPEAGSPTSNLPEITGLIESLLGNGQLPGGQVDTGRIKLATLLLQLLAQGPLADAFGPPFARPGVELAQKTVAILKRGTGPTSGEYFQGAYRAPQGAHGIETKSATVHVADAVTEPGTFMLIKQRRRTISEADADNEDDLPGGYHSFILYPYTEAGLASLEPIGWTEEINSGHQALSAWVDEEAGQIWLWTSSGYEEVPEPDPTDDGDDGDSPDEQVPPAQIKRRGLQRIRWRGVSQDVGGGTTQADVTNYKMFPGGAANGRLRGFYGDSGICSNDGRFVFMIGQHKDNNYRSDGVRHVFGWRREEVEACLDGDATNVQPIFEFVLPPMEELDADCMQDFACDGRYFYAFTGQTHPFGTHKVICVDLFRPTVWWVLDSDDARGNYTYAELLGGLAETQGLPYSFEPEGLFLVPPIGGWPHTVTQEKWGAPGDVFSWEGRNWNSILTHSDVPGTSRKTAPTTLPATVGAWDPNTTYAGHGANTLVRAVVCRFKQADGDPGDKPLNAGLTSVKSSAALTLNRAVIDIAVRYGEEFRVGYHNDFADKYTNLFRVSDGVFRIYDTDKRGDWDKTSARMAISARTVGGARQEYASFSYAGTGITGFYAIRVYGPADAATARRVSIGRVFGSGEVAPAEYQPDFGWKLRQAASTQQWSVDAIGAVVGNGFVRPNEFTRQTLPTASSSNIGRCDVSNPEAGKSYAVRNWGSGGWKYEDGSAVSLT